MFRVFLAILSISLITFFWSFDAFVQRHLVRPVPDDPVPNSSTVLGQMEEPEKNPSNVPLLVLPVVAVAVGAFWFHRRLHRQDNVREINFVAPDDSP